ncbi:MAG TPA: carboxypeptidase-like regulatory domain-containing protein, partial [bacterium]|nr:carboxypeptidase-like regulatory domain-containing protein [bacterium]
MKWARGLLIVLLAGAGVLQAGTTGKIRGIAVDRDTGAPLPGANVVLVGTSLGAAAGLDGEFFILQVPPGTYTVRASMIGRQSVVIENVVVKVDLTTTLRVRMVDEAIALGKEVTVYAEAPVIQKDVTASIQNIGI